MDDLTRQRLNRLSEQGRRETAARFGMEAGPMYYDRAGNPIGLGDWAWLGEQLRHKRVAETTVGEAWVSTVWLGLDHSFGFGPPLIFETMIFGGALDGWQDRYTDEASALLGHFVAVALAQSVPWWRTLAWVVKDSFRSASRGYSHQHLRGSNADLAPLWTARGATLNET